VKDVTSGPARDDRGLAGELDVGAQRGADAADVGVAFLAVIPPSDLLGNPAGDRQRDFAVALTSRCGFEFGNTLFEVSTAVPPRSAADALETDMPPARRPAATRALRLCFFIYLLPSTNFETGA
jgi:hypothetical protein